MIYLQLYGESNKFNHFSGGFPRVIIMQYAVSRRAGRCREVEGALEPRRFVCPYDPASFPNVHVITSIGCEQFRRATPWLQRSGQGCICTPPPPPPPPPADQKRGAPKKATGRHKYLPAQFQASPFIILLCI